MGGLLAGYSCETLDLVVFPPLPQAILNNDDTTHLLENLEPDTPYDVSVTAIYPDESESEDLLGTERTCKTRSLPFASAVREILYFHQYFIEKEKRNRFL